MSEPWRADAAYMEWAKLHSEARYNLATSGIANVTLREMPVRLEELELTGSSAYGYPPLLQAVATHAGVQTENVVLASGTAMGNHLALAGLLEAGDEVLIESPAYGLLAAVARYLGADVVTFPRRLEDGFAIDADEVRRRLSPRTRLIVLTNLHNPSSVLTDEATLRAVGDLAREAGARVLVDEVYLDAVFEGAPRSAFHVGPEFVVTSSLTKVYGLSGLRCGWILADAALAQRLWRLNDIFAATFPHVTERLAVIALAHLSTYRERARRLLAANRPLLEELFAGRTDLDACRPRWGTTVFPRLRRGSVERLCELLRDRYDTSVVPGRFFCAESHFRIGIGGVTEDVREGLLRLGAALDELAI